MARYLTRGVVALLDRHPDAGVALSFPKPYTPRVVALVGDQEVAPSDHDDIVRVKHPSIDAAFKVACKERIPWVSMRRDLADPQTLIGQLLWSTGKRANKDVPGFAALLVGPNPRPLSRLLAVVDLADAAPSGLMALAAVATAQAAGAHLDVLVLGAPGQTLGTPTRAEDVMRVTRDADLFAQARRRVDEQGDRATWVVVEEPGDRIALVLDQVQTGDYDLVIEDLGAIKLGGPVGRSGRIQRALTPEGPGGIVRALLEQTDVPVAIVLDGVRLGVVPPSVVKAGAGTVLALGIMASAAPTASASAADRAQEQTSVSQTVDAYDAALDEAASMAAPADVAQATQAAEQVSPTSTAVEGTTATEAAPEEAAAEEAAAAEDAVDEDAADEGSADDGDAKDGAADEGDDGAGGDDDEGDADEGDGEDGSSGDEASGDEGADDGGADEPADAASELAPSELAPSEVKPADAKDVNPDSVEVAEDVDSEDVEKAEAAEKSAAKELSAAEDEFAAQQDEAVEAADAAEEAAAAAADAQAGLIEAEQAYQATAAETEPVISDATGVSGALPGGASAEDLAEAEQAQDEALADVADAQAEAVVALEEYEAAASEATETYVELEAAAEDVTAADAAHEEASATAAATEAAHEEAMASARVTPVPGYEITTDYGVPGEHWSTGYHTGVDYAAPEGTDVVAAASGTVVYAQNDGGSYGNRVVIEHEDGYYTTYNHLSQIDVEVGQEVTAGDTIGEVGNTGNSFGAHLHFEVTQGGDGWSSGSFVDPGAWLAGETG